MSEPIIETHAKLEDLPTTLEQVWGGYNELSKYGTLEEPVYKSSLDDMNRADLENHARRVGVIVVESSARLKDNLIKEFIKYKAYLRKPAPTPKAPQKISEEAKKILAEGR